MLIHIYIAVQKLAVCLIIYYTTCISAVRRHSVLYTYVSLESELSLFLDKFCQAEKTKQDGSSNIHRSGLSGLEPLVKVGELLF